MIRTMKIEDYEAVRSVWMDIKGFVIRSVDDSFEGIERFINRNPNTCVVATEGEKIVGSILCGHDGRKGCMYHVCVHPEYRLRGIGKEMVAFAIEKLKKEKISNVSIVAFSKNEIGNIFWKELGWSYREDINLYEIRLNNENNNTQL